MKFICKQDIFLNYLKFVKNTISAKVTNPILSNIFIEAFEGCIKFTSTDLNITTIAKFEATIEEPGNIIVPAKLLEDIISSLNTGVTGTFSFTSTENDEVRIESGRTNYSIKLFHEGSFPEMTKSSGLQNFKLKCSDILDLFRSILYAAPTEQSEPQQFNGILLAIDSSKMMLVTTDSRKMALKQIEIDGEGCPEKIDLLIPPKAFFEIKQLLSEEEFVIVHVYEKHVGFEFANAELISSLLNEPFPPYAAIMNYEEANVFNADKEELLKSLKAILPMAKESVYTIEMIIEHNNLILKSMAQAGEAVTEMEIEQKYPDKKTFIRLNAKYLIDLLSVYGEDKININLMSNEKPAYFSSISNNNYKNCILPVIYK